MALRLADRAGAMDEVPVGAVLVAGDRLIGCGHNRPIQACDPTEHAEISALRDAAQRSGNYRLPGTTLYVTLEPCPMCAGALIHARVSRVVAAAADPRTGAAGSRVSLFQPGLFNHDVTYSCGLMAEQSSIVLRRFFKRRR